ncbi:hypothetical protein [Xanthomonas sacchari]|nr:hypothetical protein [Xanthomonas sacchari]
MKKRFSEEQIIGFLHEAEAGVAVKDQRGGGSAAGWPATPPSGDMANFA